MLIRSIFALSFISISSFLLGGQAKAENSSTSGIHWLQLQMQGKPSLRGSAVIGNSMWVTGANNSVFVSQDGGRRWQNKSVFFDIATDFRDIALFDKDTAIVMGIGSGHQSALFKTQDGGSTWHLLYQNPDKEGFFDAIAFWDEDNGLLMGDPVDGFYVVMRTSDGGKSWQRVAKDKLPEMNKQEAAFAASGNTLIVGEKDQAWLTTGGYSASVYYSSDHGKSWQRSPVPIYSETQTAGGYGLGLNSKQQVFVVGGDYQNRPGQYPNMATWLENKWTQVNSGNQGLRTAFSCQSNICITTGKTGNDISFDHGNSWQVLENDARPERSHGFYTLASDKQRFLLAGANGKVSVLTLGMK